MYNLQLYLQNILFFNLKNFSKRDTMKERFKDKLRETKTLDQIKKEHIIFVLNTFEWRIGQTAQALGVTPKSVYNYVEKYKFKRPKKFYRPGVIGFEEE